jgi:hypothetical protein
VGALVFSFWAVVSAARLAMSAFLSVLNRSSASRPYRPPSKRRNWKSNFSGATLPVSRRLTWLPTDRRAGSAIGVNRAISSNTETAAMIRLVGSRVFIQAPGRRAATA